MIRILIRLGNVWLLTVNAAFDPDVSVLVACGAVTSVEVPGVWLPKVNRELQIWTISRLTAMYVSW